MMFLRKTLITEEWAVAHEWMTNNPARFGPEEDLPDLIEFLDNYVPSFVDSVGLFINDDMVAIGIVDDVFHVHCIVDPAYPNKIAQARAIKKALIPYARNRYKCLYTEFVVGDDDIEKFIRFLGFAVLPVPLNKAVKQAAMIMRNTKDGQSFQTKNHNNSKPASSSQYRRREGVPCQAH